MKIANFREYVAVLREIYTQEAMGEMGKYYYALMASGAELKKKKAALQKEIYRLTKLIKQQAERIRVAEDKKAAGLEMKVFQQQKQQQVRLLKDLQDSNHFNTLSDDAKVNVCSGFLLQKYLARELIENNPLRFQTNAQGDLVVDVKVLRQSDIFGEAEHLRDFVAAYMVHNPEKVKTPGYFKTLLNGVKDWKALLAFANAYFDKMNDNDFLQDGVVKASRQGCEVIKSWPERGLQLVRLHTVKALDYESDKMKNCVGKGGYDKGVLSGKTHIYSLRDMSDEGEWQPHVTIEYTENTFKQIYGYKNRIVGAEYRQCVREAVAAICGSDDFSGLNKDKNSSIWKSMGYLVDETGKLHDMTDMRESAVFSYLSINDLPQSDDFLPLMTVKKLMCSTFNEDTVARLKKLKAIGRLSSSTSLEGDYRQLRDFMTAVFGSSKPEELAERVDETLLIGMGYVKELLPIDESQMPLDEAQKNLFLNFSEDMTGPDWLDMMHLDRDIRIRNFNGYGSLWSDANLEHIFCHKVEVSGKTKAEELQNISRLSGCNVISFDKTEFDKDAVIDLGRVTGMEDDNRRKASPLSHEGFFLEGLSVTNFMSGKAVLFRKCTNLPEGDKIIFPPEVKHIMLEEDSGSQDNVKKRLPDFSRYKQLESLQINSYDLSENEVIRLPENLKYLAFYKCKFGKEQVMDLSRFKNLEVLRICNSDLCEVEQFAFPESLKVFAVGNGKVKKGISWDFSHCSKMNVVDFSVFGQDCSIDVGHIAFPKEVEAINLKGGRFSELEDLDLSGYSKLKKVNLSFASFPKLKKVDLPENCVLEQEKLKIPDGMAIDYKQEVVVPEIPRSSLNEQLKARMFLTGIQIVDAH